MKIVFFSRPKARQYDYKPRYYDQKKDEREQRRKELGLADNEGGKRAMFMGELQKRWRGDGYKKDKEGRRKRIMIYMIIIAFATYYIFFTDFLQKLVTALTTN